MKNGLKIFLSGQPKIGKSTIISAVYEQFKNKNIIGCIVKENLEHNERTGFKLIKIPTNEEIIIASKKEKLSEIFVSNYSININALEKKMIPFMEHMAKNNDADLLIFDEIGKMQNKSNSFLKALNFLLQSNIPTICTILEDNEIWAKPYKNKKYIFYITATKENRNEIPKIICDLINSATYFNELENIKKLRIVKLFNIFLKNNSFNEIEKLLNHTIKYVAKNRLLENNIVAGDHKNHKVTLKNKKFNCECDFFQKNLKQKMCSHIQTVIISKK